MVGIVFELELKDLQSWTEDAIQSGIKHAIISKEDIQLTLQTETPTPVPGALDDQDEFNSIDDQYPSPTIILYRGEASHQDIVKAYMKWVNNEP